MLNLTFQHNSAGVHRFTAMLATELSIRNNSFYRNNANTDDKGLNTSDIVETFSKGNHMKVGAIGILESRGRIWKSQF